MDKLETCDSLTWGLPIMTLIGMMTGMIASFALTLLIFSEFFIVRRNEKSHRRMRRRRPEAQKKIKISKIPTDWVVLQMVKAKLHWWKGINWETSNDFTMARLVKLSDGTHQLHTDEGFRLIVTNAITYKKATSSFHHIMWKDKTGEHAVGLQFWDTKKADSFGDAFESALKLSLSMSVKIDHSQKLTSSQPREAVGEEMKNKSSPLPAQSVATMALLLLQTKKNFV